MEITSNTIIETGTKIIVECIEEGYRRKKTIRLIGSTKRYILEKMLTRKYIIAHYQLAE